MAHRAQQPLWRECVDWLDRCKILRSDQFPPGTDLIHFGQFIRDGVLLCHLITKLDPSALDFRDVCQRTQMSQYMSLKNIRLFLRACRKFDLGDSDLFEPAMLFDYTDFGRVLRCLSKLSKCPKVARLGIEGFPAVTNRHLSEDEEIYKGLEDFDQEEQFPEYCYSTTDENIYEDLCSAGRNSTSQTHSLLKPPVEKRDYLITELVDTEKNYIEALAMIKTKFIRPLSNVLTEEEKKCIFYGLEKLHEIHTGFYSDLIKACTSSTGLKLPTVFLNWKEKFLLYGDLCSNLTIAQHTIETAMMRSKVVADEIERCQREARNFNLKDIITVPMQRVLKYPLLLTNLCSTTDKAHEDYHGLLLAQDAMIDVAEYINEAKRDYEMRQIIGDVQASISDWGTTENSSLIEYGRLIKDGELKMRSHEESRGPKLRYVFLLSRGVIFCKATRGDQYSFRLFLPLHKYKLEDCPVRGHSMRQDLRWTHQWILVDNQRETAYTLYAKSREAKNKWIRAFNEALDDLNPPEAADTDHNYVLNTFSSSTAENCDLCKKLFKGSIFQGYKCTKCQLSSHRKCLGVVKGCGVPIPPPRPLSVPRPVSPPANPLNFDQYPWYAGDMAREPANSALRTTPVGTYLVRFKANEKSYAISLKTGDEIKHMKVFQDYENGSRRMQYFLSESFPCRSVVDLINRYTHNSLRESFKGLDAFLEVPWKHVYQTARVIADYVAEDPNMNLLSIFRGQHIIVVSKEGDATGWWKGRYHATEGYFPKEYVEEDDFYRAM